MARGFDAAPDLPGVAGRRRSRQYDLKVNHPLTIGDTEVFLIGHGYAPVITVRDGEGDVVYSGPTVFLPTDQTLPVLRRGQGARRRARPRSGSRASSTRRSRSRQQTGSYFSAFGNAARPDDLDARLHRRPRAWTPASRSRSTRSTRATRTMLTQDRTARRTASTCGPGETVELPDGLGLGELRRRRALEQAPDQPDARQAGSRWPAWSWR